MKLHLRTVIPALLVGLAGLAAEPQTAVHLDFASQPEWTARTLPSGQKYTVLEREIPIPAVKGRDFSFEAKLKVLKIGHYGSVLVGLGSSGKPEQNVLVRFSKSEGKNRVFFYTGVGLKTKADTAPAFVGFRQEPYSVRIDYRAADTSVRWQIRTGDGKMVHDTGWVKSHTPLEPDRILIRASDKKDLGGAQICYDPEGKKIFARSLIGYEGGIGYTLEMEILDIVLVF